jgi:trimethylamine:corrinoid methyltransferase-like protein
MQSRFSEVQSSKITYNLAGGLQDEQIRHMHEKALHLAEEVGLWVAHEGVLKLLEGRPGVTIRGERVHFSAKLMDESWRGWSCPYPPSTDWTIISGGMMLVVVDLETGHTRQPTYQDLVDLARLGDSYRMTCAPSVYPMDLPQPIREIAMFKGLWESAEHTISGLYEMVPRSTIPSAECIFEMSKVVDKPYSLGLWIISPFKVDPSTLDIILHFLDRKVPLYVGTMPVTGITAPIFLVGAYLQSMAEVLAGFTLLTLLSRGSPVFFGGKEVFRAYTADMKFAAQVYGSPEDILITLIERDLNHYYGLPVVAKSLNTTSKEPDARAAVERALHTLAAAMAGIRVFVNAGQLYNMSCAEQLVIDYEIVQQARRVLEGYEFSEQALSYDTIRSVVQRGEDFLTHDTTIKNFRRLIWQPEAFDRTGINIWETDPVSFHQKVRQIARSRIRAHNFRLEASVQNELDRIYAHYAKILIP